MQKFDLVTMGGGLTGVAAAISAARQGMSVLLIEKAGCLGGAAVNCLVNPFMPNATTLRHNGCKEKVELSRGIFEEIRQELTLLHAIQELRFKEEYLKLVLDRMVKKAGVQVLFHAVLTGIRKSGEKLEAVEVITKGGKLTFSADYFIDATGDADLAVQCGCPYHLGREEDHLCQPMTLCFRLVNVDVAKFDNVRGRINELYRQKQKTGEIKNPREDVLIFHHPIKGVLHVNSTRIIKLNPVDPFDLTRAETEAREQVLELFEFLKSNFEEFRDSELMVSAPNIGVRESRMIDGVYLLTGDDLKACTKFEDAIAAGNYDIDIHNPEGGGTSHYYFPEGEYYTIPYRSLQPKGISNMLVAGRCISSTHEAQASYRIMPICCCLGEAAGIAASVAANNNVGVGQADIRAIQSILRQNDAFF